MDGPSGGVLHVLHAGRRADPLAAEGGLCAARGECGVVLTDAGSVKDEDVAAHPQVNPAFADTGLIGPSRSKEVGWQVRTAAKERNAPAPEGEGALQISQQTRTL